MINVKYFEYVKSIIRSVENFSDDMTLALTGETYYFGFEGAERALEITDGHSYHGVAVLKNRDGNGIIFSEEKLRPVKNSICIRIPGYMVRKSLSDHEWLFEPPMWMNGLLWAYVPQEWGMKIDESDPLGGFHK